MPWGKGICWVWCPSCCRWALDPVVGHRGDAGHGDLNSHLSGAAKRKSGTVLRAAGIQGWSRRDPGSQQGAWREQRLLPLLRQKAKLPLARAVPKPLQLPQLYALSFLHWKNELSYLISVKPPGCPGGFRCQSRSGGCCLRALPVLGSQQRDP